MNGFDVDSIEVLELDASIDVKDAIYLFNNIGVPEGSFFDGLDCTLYVTCTNCKSHVKGKFCCECGAKLEEPKPIKLERFDWSGCNSENFKKDMVIVAQYIEGTIKGIARYSCWDSGDPAREDVTHHPGHEVGFAIKDGKFTTCEVKRALVLPEGW